MPIANGRPSLWAVLAPELRHAACAAESQYLQRSQLRQRRGNAECVEFIKQTLNAPRTVLWREGVKIAPAEGAQTTTIAPGTAIATFVQGRYPQVGNTGMHAAIYIGQNTQGIQVLDQWRAQGRVMPRTIPWKPRRPGLSNDGSAFSVIEW